MATLTKSTNNNVHGLRLQFDCSQETMGHIIGVSGRTIARWEADESHPTFLAREKISELQEILTKMQDVIKKGKETEWLNSPNEALGNKTPLEIITRGREGIQEVLHLLGRIEWGIYT
ncbi:MAG: DUF2384 domain-containing protein [Syntrophaceae bacterium]|nr:DUF2384 domain-containing protein [Pseudomonadota bacterium]MCG2740415.1 DUF2384 domain-containing protein [Syntrophaceae bacterium]